LSEVAVVLKIGAGLAAAHGKPSAKQAGGKCGYFGDVNLFSVECGAFAARSREEFVIERIEDRGRQERVSLRKRDGNAKAGIAVRAISSAVQRINVPAKIGS